VRGVWEGEFRFAIYLYCCLNRFRRGYFQFNNYYLIFIIVEKFKKALARLVEKKDTILNNFSVNFTHESGASYTFDWDGLSEDISEIQNPAGPPTSIRKTSLPLVVKVLHTGVAQVLVRYQHEKFKENSKKPMDNAYEQFKLLKAAGKLKTEQDVEELISTKEYDTVIKLLNSEFIWLAGKYTVIFEFNSPHKITYKKNEYVFELSQEDINVLKENIETVKVDLIEVVKVNVIKDYKRKEVIWNWRYPEIRKVK
jgi:hypothetical protein